MKSKQLLEKANMKKIVLKALTLATCLSFSMSVNVFAAKSVIIGESKPASSSSAKKIIVDEGNNEDVADKDTDEPQTAGGIEWEVTSGELYISANSEYKFPGKMEDYTKDKPAPWSSYSSEIESITVDGSVISIGNYAFYGLKYVTSIEIQPMSLEKIGDYAFSGLTSFEGDEGEFNLAFCDISKLGTGVFDGMSSIETLRLGVIGEFGDYTFGDLPKLSLLDLSYVDFESDDTKLGLRMFDGLPSACKIEVDSSYGLVYISAKNNASVNATIDMYDDISLTTKSDTITVAPGNDKWKCYVYETGTPKMQIQESTDLKYTFLLDGVEKTDNPWSFEKIAASGSVYVVDIEFNNSDGDIILEPSSLTTRVGVPVSLSQVNAVYSKTRKIVPGTITWDFLSSQHVGAIVANNYTSNYAGTETLTASINGEVIGTLNVTTYENVIEYPTITFTSGKSRNIKVTVPSTVDVVNPDTGLAYETTGFILRAYYDGERVFSSMSDSLSGFESLYKNGLDSKKLGTDLCDRLADYINENNGDDFDSKKKVIIDLEVCPTYRYINSAGKYEYVPCNTQSAVAEMPLYRVKIEAGDSHVESEEAYALEGAELTLKPTVKSGYKITHWGDEDSSSSSRTITVSSNTNKNTYKVYTSSTSSSSTSSSSTSTSSSSTTSRTSTSTTGSSTGTIAPGTNSGTGTGSGGSGSDSGDSNGLDSVPKTGESNAWMLIVVVGCLAAVGCGYAMYIQLCPAKENEEKSSEEDDDINE